MSEKSKKISYALRHAPDKFGLDMKEDGFVLLADLCDKLDIPLDDVRNIVDNDNKQRFIISDGRILGHPRSLYSRSSSIEEA